MLGGWHGGHTVGRHLDRSFSATFSDFSGQRGYWGSTTLHLFRNQVTMTVENISKLIDMAIDHA